MALVTVQLGPDAPITEMDDSLLERREYVGFENEFVRKTMTEYWLEGYDAPVHSSAVIDIKKAPLIAGAQHGKVG